MILLMNSSLLADKSFLPPPRYYLGQRLQGFVHAGNHIATNIRILPELQEVRKDFLKRY